MIPDVVIEKAPAVFQPVVTSMAHSLPEQFDTDSQ
jgi:hypothetical protein